MLKKRLQLMITGKMLKRLKIIMGLTIIMLELIIAYQVLSPLQFKLCIVLTLMCAAYVEYHRRKLVAEFKQETDRKLKQQADKFHDGLWNMIFSKGWRIEDHVTLLHLDGEFIEIHPSPKYTRTNPRYINRSNGNPKAATLNER